MGANGSKSFHQVGAVATGLTSWMSRAQKRKADDVDGKASILNEDGHHQNNTTEESPKKKRKGPENGQVEANGDDEWHEEDVSVRATGADVAGADEVAAVADTAPDDNANGDEEKHELKNNSEDLKAALAVINDTDHADGDVDEGVGLDVKDGENMPLLTTANVSCAEDINANSPSDGIDGKHETLGESLETHQTERDDSLLDSTDKENVSDIEPTENTENEPLMSSRRSSRQRRKHTQSLVQHVQ